MRNVLLLACVVAGLCIGQGCPAPSATQTGKGINPGVYSGTMTCNTTLTGYDTNGQVAVVNPLASTQSNVTVEFGQDGSLLNSSKNPVSAGDTSDTTLGNAFSHSTVTATFLDADSFQIHSNLTQTIATDTQTITLTGNETRTYTQATDGSVQFNRQCLTMSGVTADGALKNETVCSATLR